MPHFMARREALDALRAGYARVLGCPADDVALTTSTSEGLGVVLAGFELGPGDEIVTSDQEHPGLIGPLRAARERGVSIRVVPFGDLADAVGPRTRMVACSHVSWVTGEIAPAALAETGVPVVLDGAQGVGAIPIDLEALGCVAYAGAGQKWLCGADATGMLWLSPAFREQVAPVAPSYHSFAGPAAIDAPLRDTAERFDTPAVAREGAALSLAALEVLESFGIDAIQSRARELAALLVGLLGEQGRVVAARGDTTLVSWEDEDPPATRERLAASGIVVRDLPGWPYLRASVGAWNDEGDLERLVGAL
jgi:L-cysteine/cystine lyase